MKQKKIQCLTAAILALYAMTALTGCSRGINDYIDMKPYIDPKQPTVTDEDRVKHAEQTLGITLDKQHDWQLSTNVAVTILADAKLDNISEVAVLDADPYDGESHKLATATATNGAKATLSFLAPKWATELYAACLDEDGNCVVRSFVPGKVSEVSFAYRADASQAPASRRADMTTPTLKNKDYYMSDFMSFRKRLRKILPAGQNNISVIGQHNYTNTVNVRVNPYDTHDISLVYIGGDSGNEDALSYLWTPSQPIANPETFLIQDDREKGWPNFSFDEVTKQYELIGYQLFSRKSDGGLSNNFTTGDVLSFSLVKNGTVLEDEPAARVKIIQHNLETILCCEDGTDWDYNDRMYWIPFGQDRLEEIVKPEPTEPIVWTYAFEDQDLHSDYDMNDCVIQVQDHPGDPTKLDITLVALGATRDLWLYFENKQATSNKDYTPVFDKELHELLGVAHGTMVNTGRATAKPVTITLSKPSGFNYQTCSFVLGAKQEGSMKGVYENDIFIIHIPTVGQDPHGVAIPCRWQWPTETTCIKDAYKNFSLWASDRTKALDWYKYPEVNKVYSTK